MGTHVHATRGLLRWWGPHGGWRSTASVTGAFVAASVLGVLGWLTFVAVPPVHVALEQADGAWIVADLPVAEFAWLNGVRPGMTVTGFEPAGIHPSPDWNTLVAWLG